MPGAQHCFFLRTLQQICACSTHSFIFFFSFAHRKEIKLTDDIYTSRSKDLSSAFIVKIHEPRYILYITTMAW